MNIADGLAFLAIAVSVASLVVALRRQERDANLAFIRALQGDIASVAYVAAVIRQTGRIPKGVDEPEIAAALCIAWVYEERHRTRAVVLGAILKLAENDPQLIRDTVDQLDRDFERYLAAYDGDIIEDGILRRGRNRVNALRQAVRGVIPETLASV